IGKLRPGCGPQALLWRVSGVVQGIPHTRPRGWCTRRHEAIGTRGRRAIRDTLEGSHALEDCATDASGCGFHDRCALQRPNVVHGLLPFFAMAAWPGLEQGVDPSRSRLIRRPVAGYAHYN